MCKRAVTTKQVKAPTAGALQEFPHPVTSSGRRPPAAVHKKNWHSGLTARVFVIARSYPIALKALSCTVLLTSDKLLLVATGRLMWLLAWPRAAAWCSGLCTLQVMGKQAQGLRLLSGRQGAAGSSP